VLRVNRIQRFPLDSYFKEVQVVNEPTGVGILLIGKMNITMADIEDEEKEERATRDCVGSSAEAQLWFIDSSFCLQITSEQSPFSAATCFFQMTWHLGVP
jgi:hypothetical protein